MTAADIRSPGRPSQPLTPAAVREVATRIIADKGYQATTIRDIAETLGVRKASVFHHIGSKEQLLFDIIHAFQQAGQGVPEQVAAAGGRPQDRLRLFVRLHLEHIAADPSTAKIVVHELRWLDGDYLDRAIRLRDQYEDALMHLVREGQASGVFNTNLDPRVITIGLLSMLNTFQDWYRPGRRLDVASVADQYVTLWLNGLEVSATAEP